ncbi:sugar transferase [Candidatus Kaiserbacteria bacterium]|nr:sugar transferase [Candidatus Kaiserbacteria bacterium]
MSVARKQEPLVLLVGDILFFLAALWLTLFVRYAEIPNIALFYNHLTPFSVLFVVWVGVYFISGLYDKHTTLLRSRLPSIILNAQAINITIAALFFFFIPYFGIAPKTNLILYLIISSLLVLSWRIYIFPRFGVRNKQKAALIGYAVEVKELVEEVNNNPRYNLEFVTSGGIDTDAEFHDLKRRVENSIYSKGVSVVVADIKSRKIEGLLASLYALASPEGGLMFLDIHNVYESIFDRISPSAVNERWILENVSTSPKFFYNTCKRAVDIVGAVLLGIFSFIAYPFVFFAIKIEDKGPVFIVQKRVGRYNRIFHSYKFRSMERNEDGVWVGESTNKITRVGSFLRKTRIDELPQLWNVLKGDLSFVGPRPDISGLNTRLVEEIPYYNVRNVIQPGLTGWAQIKQDYGNIKQVSPQSVKDTRVRLTYDLYYVKNRSLIIDLYILARTIKTVLSRFGS